MQILALSDVHGRMEMMRKVREVVNPRPDMIVFTGDIVKGKARGDEWLEAQAQGRDADSRKEEIGIEAEEDILFYEEFLEVVRGWGPAAFIVPGNMDAPRLRYFEWVLRSAAKSDNVWCVHGERVIFGGFIVSGVGGEITEDDAEDFFVLRIPRWEVEYSLSFLSDFKERKILLFHTPPVGLLDLEKGNHKGSMAVNEMIEKHRPWLAFCGHAHNSRGKEEIGESLVINPGSLKAGNYAVVDCETREVEFCNLTD